MTQAPERPAPPLTGRFQPLGELLSQLPSVDRIGAPEPPRPGRAWLQGDRLGLPRYRLHHYFEASCDATPDATALECDGEVLSYAELDARANRLARYLGAGGIAPGARVAILLERSVRTYVALLAVLKAGATFVPVDPASPADRVEYIALDSGVDLVLTSTDLLPVVRGARCPVLPLDEVEPTLGWLGSGRPDVTSDTDDVAYIIYTSGSSGRPKGVEVAQSSICNFINVVPPLYGVGPADRVYQGMTIAFDFSIEEVWPTWAVGATLVAGPTDGRRLGTELADFLESNGITILYCVPTVLATIDRDLPRLHTLNVGGEACPQELVERWGADDRRRILNTYGPTEATVTATMAELSAGRPVTIGRPLPTYQVQLLDANLRRVAPGAVGEICIGGPGVARGYVGRPDLTADRFVPDPVRRVGRMYRTGDLGRYTWDGEIEYLGRADSEVKVRGHRVDLGEIEGVLRQDPGVADVVAALSGGELAAYYTRSGLDAHLDEAELTARLHERCRQDLPPYMVPAFVVVMAQLPMLPSGKVDRKGLPAPQGARLVTTAGPHTEAANGLERAVTRVWAEVLGLEPEQVSADADFFLELGGHSLAAATVVSQLRRQHGGARLAIGDLYANPTVHGLAGFLSANGTFAAEPAVERTPPRRASRLRVALAGGAQLGFLFALVLLFALPVALVYAVNGGEVSRVVLLQMLATLPVSYLLGRWVLPVVGTRALSWRLRAGEHPLWGATHLRVWAVQKLLTVSPLPVLAGSPLLKPYLRLLGAKVGRGCYLASGDVNVPSLTEIRTGASVGYAAQLHAAHVSGGSLVLAPVVVGHDAFVGASSMVVAGSEVGAGAALGEHSVLGPDEEVPDGERWVGSPAAPARDEDPVLAAMAACPGAPRDWPRALRARFAVGVAVLELLPLVALAPAVAMVWFVLLRYGTIPSLLATLVSGPVFVATTCLLIALLRGLLVESTPTGIFHVVSPLGVQKWFLDKLLEFSLLATNSLYSTLYTAPWLRMLGARIGRGAEVSTVAHIDPELLDLADGSFVADMASVGSATYHNGHIGLGRTSVGRRAFVGNASSVPSGVHLGEESLVGVHTVPPRAGTEPGTTWLGSPAIFLPRRQESDSFDEGLTFRPSRAKVLERLAIEFVRVTAPSTLLGLSTFGALYAESEIARTQSAWVVVLTLPLLLLALGLTTVLVVAGVKWLVVGRYRPRVEPLWSRFVRRSELVTGLYEAAAVPALLQGLTGTPLLGPVLRLFGARVGRRTYVDTTFLTEFDLVSIGDDATVAQGASLQTHLFEDRVMKMSRVTIERSASVGARSVVLYDAVVDEGAQLGPLSLVMKGETLLPGTHWTGIPAQAVD